MKKLMILLSLLVLALFVVSCAPKEGADGDDGALAGQAVKLKSDCVDTDKGKNYEMKGTVSLRNGQSNTDYCTENILHEYFCTGNKISSVTYNCGQTGNICTEEKCTNTNCPLKIQVTENTVPLTESFGEIAIEFKSPLKTNNVSVLGGFLKFDNIASWEKGIYSFTAIKGGYNSKTETVDLTKGDYEKYCGKTIYIPIQNGG